MNEPWKIIQQLESDNGKLFKEDVIRSNIDNQEFVAGLQLALDNMVTFGVAQVPEKKDPTFQNRRKNRDIIYAVPLQPGVTKNININQI